MFSWFTSVEREKRRLQRLAIRAKRHRDVDFETLKRHCVDVQKAREALARSLEAEKKSNQERQAEIDKLEDQLEKSLTRVSQLEDKIADLEISLDASEHRNNKLKQDLELSVRLAKQLAEVVERDRQRVIAEKNAYIALGEKAGSQ